jgi:hypothetical protein
MRLPALLTALLVLVGPAPLPSTATSAQGPAPLSLHPDNHRYLLFRGKPALVITSGEHYGAVLNLDFDYRRYLDTLARDGMNATRTWVGTYVETGGNFNIKGNTLDPAPGRFIAPWARSTTPGYADGGNRFDLTRWDEAYFARLRAFLQHASDRGIIVELVIFCPLYEESMWEVSPMNARNNVNGLGAIKRQDVLTLDRSGGLLAVQEAVARKVAEAVAGFDNVYIEVCNEPYATSVPDDWQRHMATVIQQAVARLPRPVLISQNVANYALKVENPHPAISIFNFHYATPPDAVALNAHVKGVIGDNETGFRGTTDDPYRMEAWDFLLAGGGLYNNLDYSFTAGHEDGTFAFPTTQPGGGGPALRRQLRILRDFMNGFEFLRMRPDNAIVKSGVPSGGSARVFADAGRAYAVYLRRLVGSGPFSARWTGRLVAPASGEYSIHTVSNDGVRLRLDDRLLIEDWTDHGAKEDTARVTLEAGRAYRLTLEYFYNGGQGTMKLAWTPPGGSRAPVPASALSTAPGAAGLRGEFFQGNSLERAWFTRTDAQVDFLFSTTGPLDPASDRSVSPLALDLPAGDWYVTWLDPVNGSTLRAERIDRHAGGARQLDTPSWKDDVAVSVRRREAAKRDED